MLGPEYPGCERAVVVTGMNGYAPVRDGGTVIVFVIHEVDGWTTVRGAGRQQGTVHPSAVHAGAAEFRQRGRMNVHDAARERPRYIGRNVLQIAGEHDEIGHVTIDDARERNFFWSKTRRADLRRDPRATRAIQRRGGRAIRGENHAVSGAPVAER